MSSQQNGELSYFTLDYGYNVVDKPMYRVGAFVGYSFIHETVNAYGCAQTQSNPDICVPTIAPTVLGITEDAKWQSIRLGLAADVLVFECLRIGGEAAWLPYASMRSTDDHWLREDIFGPISEPASGSGVQLEAFATYQLNAAFSIGAGARYWRLTSTGQIDLEAAENIAGAVAQPGTFKTDRYGFYAQAAYKFGLD